MGDFQYPPACEKRMEDGSTCPVPAAHHWGPFHLCCTHFDMFVRELLDLPHTARLRHIDIVEEYNRQCRRGSLLPGGKCDAEKKPGT